MIYYLKVIKYLKTYKCIGSLGIAHTQNSIHYLDSWSPGAGFIPIIATKGINQIK